MASQPKGHQEKPGKQERIKISQTELVIAREKTLRAYKHLQVAARLIRRFVRNECRIRSEFNPKTKHFDVIAYLPTPPTNIALVIGDCVHNLRSALDHVVFAMITTNPSRPDGTPSDRTMFPISDTREGHRKQIERGRIKGLADPVAALVDELQPYHTREKGLDYTLNPLWVLNKLENIDKHRRLMLASAVARHAHVSIRYADGGETDLMILQDEIHDRAILTSYPPARDGREVQMNGYMMVFVAVNEVDELPSASGNDICHVLQVMVDQIGNAILPRFARLAAGHAPPPKRRRRQDFRPRLGKKTGPL